jgi:hypothetical protein
MLPLLIISLSTSFPTKKIAGIPSILMNRLSLLSICNQLNKKTRTKISRPQKQKTEPRRLRKGKFISLPFLVTVVEKTPKTALV